MRIYSVTAVSLSLLLLAGCSNTGPSADETVVERPSATTTASRSAEVPAAGGSGAPPTTPRDSAPAPTPAPAANAPRTGGPTVVLDQPAEGVVIRTNPLELRGRLIAFENHALLRVLDASGKLILQRPVTARGDLGTLNPFEESVLVTRDPGSRLTLELLVDSPKDGSIVARASRTYEHAVDSVAAELAFSHVTGGSSDCTKTLLVKRSLPKSQQHARMLLEALMNGPTPAESARGASSPFQASPRILGLVRRDDLLVVDFDQSMSSVGGSCRAQALRATIEETLKKIPGVKRVEIRAAGSAAQALQP